MNIFDLISSFFFHEIIDSSEVIIDYSYFLLGMKNLIMF